MAKRGPVTDIGLLPRHSGEQPASSRPEHVASLDPRTATDRSLAIIDIVLSSEAPLQARMIGAELDLPKATVHRLIGSLEIKGLIVKDPVSGGYVAGPSLCDMAFKILRKSAASGTRHAILAGLAAKVGETCNLGILDGGEARYVDRVEASQSPLKLDFRPGSRVPLYCSAMGKVFLSQMPEGALARYLSGVEREIFTRTTLVSENSLRDALAVTREQGYAIDDEEYVVGVNCLSVAVPAERAKHLIAIAVQAPKSRRTLTDLKAFLPMLESAAEKIAKIFDNEVAGQR
ncbi:MAG: IclR family transcriptional regulator [Rhodomicrobiaceae bacterium]